MCKQYILQGLGIGVMPTQIICTTELREGSIVPVLPEWNLEPLDVHMIYPFELSFSTLISSFLRGGVRDHRREHGAKLVDPRSLAQHSRHGEICIQYHQVGACAGHEPSARQTQRPGGIDRSLTHGSHQRVIT